MSIASFSTNILIHIWSITLGLTTDVLIDMSPVNNVLIAGKYVLTVRVEESREWRNSRT